MKENDLRRWFNRHRYFVDAALSGLWRRKWKNGAVVMVYALAIGMLASVLFLSSSLRRSGEMLLQNAPDMVVQRTVAGRHAPMPIAFAKSLADIRGVRKVETRLWGYYFNPASGGNYTLVAPPDFSHGDDEVMVGEGVVRTWGGTEGEHLFFNTHDRRGLLLTLVGRSGPETALLDADTVRMSMATFREITGLSPAYATDLALTVRNPREIAVIARKVARRIPDARVISRDDMRRSLDGVLDRRSGFVIVVWSGALVAFFILAWEKASGIGASERYEIGVLKALGWDTGDVLLVKAWEGAALSSIAFFAGIFAAYCHVFLLKAPLLAHALRGWAVLFPNFSPVPILRFGDIATIFFLTVAPYTFLTVVPAWMAAITDPEETLRNG